MLTAQLKMDHLSAAICKSTEYSGVRFLIEANSRNSSAELTMRRRAIRPYCFEAVVMTEKFAKSYSFAASREHNSSSQLLVSPS